MSIIFQDLFIDFLRIALSLIIVILLTRIILRVEKKLDLFFKLLAGAFIIILIRHIINIFTHLEIIAVGDWIRVLELIPTLLTIYAFYVMSRIVTKLDKER